MKSTNPDHMGNNGRLRIKKRAFEIIEAAKPGDVGSRTFDILIVSLIALNVLAVMLETVQPIADRYATVFLWFEVVSVIVFTVEYILRLWACTADDRFAHPILGRIRMAIRPMVVIDLLAILPFYLPLVVTLDTRFLRAVRLLRIFRILKIGRYSRSIEIMGRVLREKTPDLVVTSFTVFILLIVASSLMYFAEHDAQPQAFPSIPATMWWGVATLTTVGYGDVYPITVAGKIIGGVIAFLGIGLFALPTGILAAGFGEELARRRSLGDRDADNASASENAPL